MTCRRGNAIHRAALASLAAKEKQILYVDTILEANKDPSSYICTQKSINNIGHCIWMEIQTNNFVVVVRSPPFNMKKEETTRRK